MDSAPTGLAARLKKGTKPVPPAPTRPSLTREEKHQRLVDWIGVQVQKLKEFGQKVGKDDQKPPVPTKIPDAAGMAGQAVVDAAIEAGFLAPDKRTVRSSKVFWIGVSTWRRSVRGRLKTEKIMKFLCKSIKENLRDC